MLKFISAVILAFLLIGCGEKSSTADQIITVEREAVAAPLFYNGIIQPIKTMVVTSPVDGVIVDMSFQYGETIKKNQLLFVLSSTKFVADYQSALMQFIKAKSEFNTSQTQLKETTFLHQNGLVSDDEFKMKQSNFYGAQLGFLQAKDVLDKLLKQMHINKIDLDDLSIAKIDKIMQAMHLQEASENLKIEAFDDGVILSAAKNDDETKKINRGDAVKQGEVLALIGDMNGISVRVKVNELTINEIKIGQTVKVTGIAFAEEVLTGKIASIDKQADTNNNGAPVFNVLVNVPSLTAAQRNLIYPGMSAKVEIDFNESTQILVPIQAVIENNGQYAVNLYDTATHTNRLVPIKTGKTTQDKVVVLSGLKAGDQIVIPH